MHIALKVQGLSKIYKNGRGIRNIDIEIQKGEIYGFLGSNGSGKTTTMKVIAGLLHKQSGSIEICGINPDEEYEAAMRHLSCVFESIIHYNYMTAYENLLQVKRYYPGVTKNKLDETLEIVGLAKHRDEKAGSFSLGMRQRLALAGAMLAEPSIMMLDEPFNGLDIEGMADLRAMILDYARKSGVAFLVSSHLADEVEKTCSRVGLIKEGNMIFTGTMDEILKSHASVEAFFLSQINGGAANGA